MFPIFLNVRQRLCVVVGGGPVGRRKAAALLAADAQVRLVCLEPRPAEMTAERLEWLSEAYRAEHLEGAFLAFAAAKDAVNRQVVGDAGQRGILCNVADNPTLGDFHLPAVVRRDNFVLAIGTGGAAPALARKVRLRLERQFDDVWGQWVGLLARIREGMDLYIKDPARRKRAYEELCRWHWLGRLRREGADAVGQAMALEVRRLAETAGDDV